jgi:DNA mismatch repair ATPase MutL
VDVNVHPGKKIVLFLDEAKIVGEMAKHVAQAVNSNAAVAPSKPKHPKAVATTRLTATITSFIERSDAALSLPPNTRKHITGAPLEVEVEANGL